MTGKSGEKIEEEAEKWLKMVGLADFKNHYPHQLSGGMKRRLMIAKSLIHQPRLLILDEPTAGMSRIDTNRTIELLSKIKQKGITKIIIEHDMHVVFSLADRISVLAQGHVIATGLPDEIRKSPKVKEAYLGGESHA